MSAHRLADQGKLDLDAPVANYWPEFAAAGKGAIPVTALLNHRAGMAAVKAPLKLDDIFDWNKVTGELARQEPWWNPGSKHGYHAITFGWLVGEVVRRVSGKSLGTFFRDEVATPLGLDFSIGLPESEERRAVRLLPRLDASSEVTGITELRAQVASSGVNEDADWWNTRAAHASELPASGGVTNARAAARMYAALSLGGTLDGVQLVSPETVVRMGTTQSLLVGDAMGDIAAPFALGFMNPSPASGFPVSRFGHEGAGGSNGFADPAARLAFGYVMNQMSETPRALSLCAATYRSLGYRQGKYGIWMPPEA
jgi:CubicO group peptidase (beta-lactamase class C family)